MIDFGWSDSVSGPFVIAKIIVSPEKFQLRGQLFSLIKRGTAFPPVGRGRVNSCTDPAIPRPNAKSQINRIIYERAPA
jgi:hypothetical protein